MRTLTIETDFNEWAEMHSLPVEDDCCPKCGISRVANIPFFSKGFRGLMSELHDCGERYRLRIFRPVGEEVKSWENIGQRQKPLAYK